MNKFERYVYDLIESKPFIKVFVRDVYQSCYDLLPKKKEFSINPIISKEGYFFGFHDVTPFSKDNTKVLANQLKFDLKMPGKQDEIKVGYLEFDGKELGDFKAIGTTRIWNYHKGCRLQWLNENELIFNRADENDEIRSRIINIHTAVVKDIDFPIDSVSPDGKLATSFSYERLEKYMPGYGYSFTDNHSYIDQKAPKKTGLYLIDIEMNTSKLLVSVNDVFEKIKHHEKAEDSFHISTHSLFSPDGKYISFIHKWVSADVRKRYSQLVIYNIQEETFKAITTGPTLSHYVWNKQNEIVAFCDFEGVQSHVLINIDDFSKSRRTAYPLLNSDGHQSFIDKQNFVVDTYPDKRRVARMYSVNTLTNKTKLLASIYSPKKFQTKKQTKHIACDLHPTASPDGKYICFDTVRSGKRALAIMEL